LRDIIILNAFGRNWHKILLGHAAHGALLQELTRGRRAVKATARNSSQVVDSLPGWKAAQTASIVLEGEEYFTVFVYRGGCDSYPLFSRRVGYGDRYHR
jgi:hypothetical protein